MAPPISPVSTAPAPDALIGSRPREILTSWGAKGILLGDPVHPDPENPQFVPPHVTVCSVFPATLRTPERAFRCVGFPQFTLPTPPPDGFTCLRVYDTIALVADVAKHEDAEWDGRDGQIPKKIPALDRSGNGGLAYDIVQKLAGSLIGANPNRMIGVGILIGDIPTKQEFDRLHEIQNAIARYYVGEADELAEARKWKEIGSLHRFFLELLGDYDPIRHPWHKEIKKQTMKSCFGCGKLIMSIATTCEHCSRDLVELAIARWRLTGEISEAVMMDDQLFPIVKKATERMQATEAANRKAAAKPEKEAS